MISQSSFLHPGNDTSSICYIHKKHDNTIHQVVPITITLTFIINKLTSIFYRYWLEIFWYYMMSTWLNEPWLQFEMYKIQANLGIKILIISDCYKIEILLHISYDNTYLYKTESNWHGQQLIQLMRISQSSKKYWNKKMHTYQFVHKMKH